MEGEYACFQCGTALGTESEEEEGEGEAEEGEDVGRGVVEAEEEVGGARRDSYLQPLPAPC